MDYQHRWLFCHQRRQRSRWYCCLSISWVVVRGWMATRWQAECHPGVQVPLGHRWAGLVNLEESSQGQPKCRINNGKEFDINGRPPAGKSNSSAALDLIINMKSEQEFNQEEKKTVFSMQDNFEEIVILKMNCKY